MLTRRPRDLRDERGVMLVLFGIVLPLILIIGAMVVSVGSWFTHARHLQTKVDAAAFAGGTEWAFPCASPSPIDQRIVGRAREYVGQHTQANGFPYTTTTYNPQVGKVQGDQIHVVLNGPSYYDGDTNPAPAERTANGICAAKYLDVKGTEENSPLLWGWLPFAPDLKRKARIQIEQANGIGGVLPIAVRAPEPVSAAAVFYNEANGAILKVKYFVKGSSASGGVPAGLQAWSTLNSDEPSAWADFSPTAATGVAIAISFRGACATNLPSNNPTSENIKTDPAPSCFEDEEPTLAELCNQTTSTQIVNCYYASGSWPTESVQSGLYFIRGYTKGDVGQGEPALRSAWLENVDCPSNANFSSVPGLNPCQVQLTVKIDVGSKDENPLPNPPPTIEQTRIADNVEVKYCLVLRSDAGDNNVCNSQFGTTEELNGTGGPGEVEFSTVAGTHLQIPRSSNGASVAIQVRMKDTSIAGVPGCDLTTNDDFSNQCRFFYTGAQPGFTSTSVPPTADAVLAAPVQRAFRGNSVSSSSVKFLSLTADPDCDANPSLGDTIYVDNQAASQPSGSPDECFLVDMGLKGGLAIDADEEPIIFNDGAGPSQMGAVDCDPNVAQGQILTIGIVNGCLPLGPLYAKHPFDWDPLCPPANSIFPPQADWTTTPNPGPPWNDGRWPPLRCIKTRPTGAMNQLEQGLDERIFGNPNQNSCPPDAAGWVRGRNYWDPDTNLLNLRDLGYKDDGPPPPAHATKWDLRDKRLVTIFLAPTEAFAGSGQNTYPIAGFVDVYITGYGRINGGNLNIDDPCPGNAGPTDLDLGPGNASGYAVWGHFINYAHPSANATPSGVLCTPGVSLDPCVAALVE